MVREIQTQDRSASNVVAQVRALQEIRTSADIVLVRHLVREWSGQIGFGLVDQTKVITAASELGRNTLVHGGGGSMQVETVVNGTRSGIRLTFEDAGRGIADVDQALRDGFSTQGGLGLGLGGSKRLVNDFQIHSRPGQGTRVVVTRWR